MSNIGQVNSATRVGVEAIPTQTANTNQDKTKESLKQTPMEKDSLNINNMSSGKANDNIFFIGLNDGSSREVAKLSKTASGKIEAVKNTTDYEITINNKKFNTLFTDSFKKLGLSDDTFNKLQNFLMNNFMASISTMSTEVSYPMTKNDLKKIINDIGMPENLSNQFYNEFTTKVGAIFNSSNGKTYNLNFLEDIKDFSQSLGLSEQKANEVEKFLSSKEITPVAKDEIASIITTFSRTEKGEQIPSRLVISSHSDGKSFFGTGEKGFLGKLEKEDLKGLSKIFPKAARQIEDLSISACNAGHSSSLEEMREIFPNLKTFMGYAGSAPGTDSGAEAHLKKWEQLTRGSKDNISPKDFQSFRKGENVSTWTEKTGFILDNSKQIERNIPEFIHSSGYIIEDYFRDDKPVKDPQNGELRTVYTNVQLVLGNTPNLSSEDKKELEKYRDRSLRLLFFNDISKKFNSTYSLQIESGYKALDMKPINFSGLSRSECRKELNNYRERFDALSKKMEYEVDKKTKSGGSPNDIQNIKDSYAEKINNAKNLLKLLDDGLINLDTNIIPENWV